MTKPSEGPKIPRLFQLIKWIADPLKYLDDCVQRYGDIFTLRLFGFPDFVFINNPEGIAEIFTTNPKKFDAGSSNGIVRPLVGENSLLLLDGDRHLRERKMLMPPFHGQKVKSYGELICQITQTVASQWQIDHLFVTRTAMQDITLEVILKAVFGLSEGERYQKIKPLLADMLDMAGRSPLSSSMLFFPFLQKDLGAWSSWGKFLRSRQEIYNLIQAEISERRANQENLGKDILSLMLSVTDEDGQPMTDEELRDQMITLLLAGHETTASSLAWAFYWIHKIPEVKQKLLQELDTLGSNPEPMEMYNLPYLTAVCQESLRIYPVVFVAFPRIAKSTVEIMGRQYEAGTVLVPSIYSVHHREDLYQEPKKFRPERFLERDYSSYEFFPFGGSNRRCLGYALAMLEMKLVIGTILSNYSLTLANNQLVKPLRRGVTIAPSNGVPIVMKGKRATKRTMVLD